jgi:hypothetical protein
MLADVVGTYVDSLTEREFDAPFIALLRLHGFTDIHFLHGPFEFGKDFIGKRNEDAVPWQYVFQTKAGNIRISEWNQCRGQIDLLRTDTLSHPNFDIDIPRRSIFVTTGRLVGGAALAAQQYRLHLESLGEAQFLTWDRDTIVEMLAADPRSLSGSSPGLLHVLGAQHRQLNFEMLEKYSRTWIRDHCSSLSLRDTLEAAVIAQHCRLENRIDLACYATLMLLRSLWATAHGNYPLPEVADVSITTGKNFFRHYALELWNACSSSYVEADELLKEEGTPAAFISYPARCLTILEILAMLGLLERNDNPELTTNIVDYLSKFVEANAGAAHPISDRWGTSVVCCALLLSLHNEAINLRSYLKTVIKWIADRYDGGSAGLAGPYAGPEEETTHLLGSPFEHTKLNRRSESYNATQLLDLCAVLEDRELFDLARNEFLAVDICLPVLEVDDSLAQYSINAGGHRFEPNMPYEEFWHFADSWKMAPHHKRGPNFFYPESAGTVWDQIAISCVVRDRHFIQSWKRLRQDIEIARN